MILSSFQMLISFILTISIIVTCHEFGHYWVAKKCGIKVLKFSIGFGKSLWRTKNKEGTEFVISMIPLGGYVKMLDEHEGLLYEKQKKYSFNNQSYLVKSLVVLAGPFANFILAIILFWLMFFSGIKYTVTEVGSVRENSIADKAGFLPGDQIIAVDDHLINSWQDVSIKLLSFIGETRRVFFSVKNSKNEYKIFKKDILLTNWMKNQDQADPIYLLGISPFVPKVLPIIGFVAKGSPAAIADLQSGDKIILANGRKIETWQQWVKLIRKNPEKIIEVMYNRNGLDNTTVLVPKKIIDQSGQYGYLGVSSIPISWPKEKIKELSYGPVSSIFKSFEASWSLLRLTCSSTFKMVTGDLSVKNIGGPLTIAKYANQSIKSGFSGFLYFLSLISISIGFINLLPIPTLDGGHFVLITYEKIMKRKINEKKRQIIMKLGIIFILIVFIVAMYNDFINILN